MNVVKLLSNKAYILIIAIISITIIYIGISMILLEFTEEILLQKSHKVVM